MAWPTTGRRFKVPGGKISQEREVSFDGDKVEDVVHHVEEISGDRSAGVAVGLFGPTNNL